MKRTSLQEYRGANAGAVMQSEPLDIKDDSRKVLKGHRLCAVLPWAVHSSNVSVGGSEIKGGIL